MPVILWLDDERNPADRRWHSYFPLPNGTIHRVKDHSEFISWIQQNSIPEAICFDHDLGDGPSGLDCAKWLVEYCLDNELALPKWNIQSANPIGKRNIAALLESFERIHGEEDRRESGGH